MDAVAALYRELDPLRPLAADDDALYVDWQHQLDPGTVDVKSRLVRAFVRNATPQRPIIRLLTGHKGSGKTTELNRVASALHSGQGGKKVFVSTLYAQRWLDIEDVQPEDLVLQIVRQLMADLQAAGMEFGVQRFGGFLQSLWDRCRGVRLETVDLGVDPLTFSFALNDFPTARREFRELLRGQLPKVNDLVNQELLPRARTHLATQGFQDIVLVIDDLDKIPQKVLSDQGLTNHENLFLDNAATLRAISCSLLMTIPIELAYSPAQGRLRDDYGAAIGTIPLVTVADRAGAAVQRGENALAEVVGRRARVAFDEPAADPLVAAKRIFADPDDLTRVLRLSGGHLRSLLVMLTELLDWVDELPVPTSALDRYLPRAAKDLARGLLPEAKDVLRTVAAGKEASSDPRFFELLRTTTFVRGLDRLGSARARSAVIAELNLNRDHLWRTVGVPVVLWAADFAVREFAQHATDLWSGRSGVYRFRPEGDDSAQTLADAAGDISWWRTPEERREREALLVELLEELDETGDETSLRAPRLTALGDAAAMQDRYDEAGELYRQALPIHREIGARLGEANTLRGLGEALMPTDAHSAAGTLADAARLYRLLGREDLAEETQRLAADAEETN